MGFFDFFKQVNINQGVEEYKATADAVLVDVRTPQEYREGHIPGSKNVPLQQLDKISSLAKIKRSLCSYTAIPAPGVVRQPVCCSRWDIPM